MSPALFSIYMDGLSHALTRTGVGCSINDTMANHIAYADDMVLLAPSVGAMRELLAECERYATEHNMTYNPDKSEFMLMEAAHMPVHIPPLLLDGVQLRQVHKVKYLGHILLSTLKDQDDIERQRRATAVRANMLARRFAKCSNDVKRQLFLSFCTSVYTVELWADYTCAAISDLRVQYNNAWRALFRLPPWCSASAMFAERRAPGWAALLRARSATARKAIYVSSNTLLSAVRVGRQ
ncbi:uncharacterized protein LOC134756216 [Cydia strobilella]|uniref:uncharacterized protein LOC134756216 n=1 Tax=Cydia strobilella TaxID=1100964 RepID=UPI0030068F92